MLHMLHLPLQKLRQALSLVLVTTLALSLLCACSSTDDRKKLKSAEAMYADAQEDMNSSSYESAIKTFEQIQSRYPFGRYAQQAMIEQAYAYWKQADEAQALSTIERFIKQYPNHPSADYMYYLRGMVNFNDNSGLLGYISGQDPTERDPKALRESFDAFKELVTRYPDSHYSEDARARMNWLVNALASHEVHVASYYYRRGAYLAAANRAQTALKDYNGARASENALGILWASYDKLGLTQLRDDTRKVLALNYPQSPLLEVGLRDRERPWWQFW
jgi:outer membrane protein assembly factor BamD